MALETFVNGKAGKTNADECANQWDDPDPLLLGIFLVEPRLFDFVLVYPPGVEVSGWRDVLYTSGRAHGGCWHGAIRSLERVAPRSSLDGVTVWGAGSGCVCGRGGGRAVMIVHGELLVAGCPGEISESA